MARPTKAPVPDLMLVLFGIPIVLAVLALLYLLHPGNAWMPRLRIPYFSARAHLAGEARLKIRVWVNRSTGIYYCPNSSMYGHSEPGAYLAQGEAVQSGYGPALGEPCE